MGYANSLARGWLALVCLSGTTLGQVAVLGSPGGGTTWNNDVKAKIEASGVNLGPVTVINVSNSTPTLTELQAFQSVLVFSDAGFQSPVTLGDNLHDYVDGGGGVVVCAFTNAVIPLTGAWAAQQYDPITTGGFTSGSQAQLGTRHLPNHPLFTVSPVVSFDGGTSSYRSTGNLAANSTRIADWTNGTIFAAERDGLNGRVLSLNFYPPSSTVRSDFWIASTDGDNLMANALEYARSCSTAVTYCTAKVNSQGCTPAAGFVGSASASASSGFLVQAANVRNMKAGLLLYGVNGRASGAFQGGTLCVKTPIKRTPSTNSGGTPLPGSDCSGVYSIDMNSFAAGGLGGSPLPALQVGGTMVDCQWWGRDPGFPPPNNTTLSDAVEYVVCP